ncbi:DUF4435 domain-containing protein [Geomonas subterranea]|uniref:DUF4435 domain-containing protein n=1 Tax=Geomonas subterranea TaxID=2847989 RepID=UPI001CD496F7|nr:DUF4435 domain-containing protein [Geomonas fuzhouensis]
MKKQDITYQDKIDELMLDMPHPNNQGQVFIFVEGESDIKLFRKFFNLANCKVESIPGGNAKLEEGVCELLNIYPLIFGIRDSDFIRLESTEYNKPNMFMTDLHDIEMSLIAEDEVFSAIVFEYSDLPRESHDSIRRRIIKVIESVSYLKWLNQIESLQLKFEGTGFQDLISFASDDLDFKEYFRRLLAKSPNAKITDYDVLLGKINVLMGCNPNPFYLCNGHDFTKVFSRFLKDQGKVKNVDENNISSALRMTFRNDLLMKTALYEDTQKWASCHNCSIY